MNNLKLVLVLSLITTHAHGMLSLATAKAALKPIVAHALAQKMVANQSNHCCKCSCFEQTLPKLSLEEMATLEDPKQIAAYLNKLYDVVGGTRCGQFLYGGLIAASCALEVPVIPILATPVFLYLTAVRRSESKTIKILEQKLIASEKKETPNK